jgi:hypothetical protein
MQRHIPIHNALPWVSPVYTIQISDENIPLLDDKIAKIRSLVADWGDWHELMGFKLDVKLGMEYIANCSLFKSDSWILERLDKLIERIEQMNQKHEEN